MDYRLCWKSMKRFISQISLFALFSALIPNMALAGGCYVDPVQQYSGTGTIKSGVYLRSEACTSGTMVLRTLKAEQAFPLSRIRMAGMP
jgi:hypothetical protein